MISEGSESQTPLQPPSSPAEAGTYLAPGFRFHPTDEELISYYLKRKITGRQIRADAISEIDLYRVEPWDLPPRSRLRSRDLEWYFFTSLDRKYSNRCRTNRATKEGYWKTTGKDRSIQRGSRTIGMKKTLVYHAGRAPRGQRTNWVMHEYRLEDEELVQAGISQDGYVLCRVFQKNGSGPQNGAQYGAPFIEEEWEREEVDATNLVPVNMDRDEHIDPAAQDFVQLGDFLQDPDSGIQDIEVLPFEATTTSDNQIDDSSIFVEDILNDLDSLDDMPQEDDFFYISHDNNPSFRKLGEKKHTSIQSKGYVQLNDIFSGDGASCSSPKSMSLSKILLQKCDEGDSPNNNGDSNYLDELPRYPETFPKPFGPSDNELWACSSGGQLAEDNLVFYDALSHEIPYSEDGFAFESSLSPLAEFELSEELMSFYDTTNDSLLYSPPNQFISQFSPLNPSEWIKSNASSSEVVGSSTSSIKEVLHAPDNLGKISSLGRMGCNDILPKDIKPEDCEDKTLTKRLASMLHSISAPPAFADESGLIGKTAAQMPSASALSLTTGMIQINNWTAMGYAESWTLQKHTELGFFSHGSRGSIVSKSVCRQPINKVLGGFYSSFCRGGLHLFLLSAVMLALSYRIGIYVCQS